MAITKSSQKKLSLNGSLKRALNSQFFSLIYIVLGAILVFTGSVSLLNLDLKHPFLNRTAQKSEVLIDPVKPTRIFIPKIAKNLNIESGQVINNRWTISPTGVSYLTDSSLPGTNGNSIMYGHNLKNILGDLPNLQNGDFLYVVLNNGQFVKYSVFEKKQITPYQVEILKQTPDSRLTIYTCSGFLDSARFVVVAKKVEAV